MPNSQSWATFAEARPQERGPSLPPKMLTRTQSLPRGRDLRRLLVARQSFLWMGSYSGLHATELDSHANMAVAGSDCTVIATSGCHATVTPFSSNLPTMDMVEIGNVAIAYDGPISLQTYLLVMRNALLIPTMDHNLIPPFLIRLAGLQVDETPKHQLALPTVDNHSIYDSETGMRIHLKLNGIFSYFPTRALTLDEIENWDVFTIVFITPDGDAWNPHTSHYAKNEEAMLDTNGLIIEHGI